MARYLSTFAQAAEQVHAVGHSVRGRGRADRLLVRAAADDEKVARCDAAACHRRDELGRLLARHEPPDGHEDERIGRQAEIDSRDATTPAGGRSMPSGMSSTSRRTP